MKKPALISMIAFLTSMPVMVRGGQNGSAAQDRGSETSKISRKPTSLSGKVGTDGKTLTADKDRRIWTVSNPEVLSGGFNGRRHRNSKAQDAWTRAQRVGNSNPVGQYGCRRGTNWHEVRRRCVQEVSDGATSRRSPLDCRAQNEDRR